MNADDKTKTGCAGILIPLFFGALALKWIIQKRSSWRFSVMTGDTAVGFGVMTLGMCLFVHALGFVPYERVPSLKYILAGVGVAVFFLGILWKNI